MSTNNPFAVAKQITSGTQIGAKRAESEIQSAMVIAKRFPRDSHQAMDRILQACARPGLAEVAQFAYPRGNAVVTGPSIRLAEAIAQQWGNLDFGMREVSRTASSSTVEAYAWDLETNTRQTKVFEVPHSRFTKKGSITLDDPRDIYELIANQAARRIRACILGVIPTDVVESAQKQCDTTMANAMGAPAEQVQKLVDAFSEYGIDKRAIARRLGHDLDATISAEVIVLRKIYQSLRDGMGKPADFFEVEVAVSTDTSDGIASINQAARDAAKQSEKEEEPKRKDEPETADTWPAKSEDGRWIDAENAYFNPAIHGMRADGSPSVTDRGVFRKRRSATKKHEPAPVPSTRPESPADPPPLGEPGQGGFDYVHEDQPSHTVRMSLVDAMSAIANATKIDELKSVVDRCSGMDKNAAMRVTESVMAKRKEILMSFPDDGGTEK